MRTPQRIISWTMLAVVSFASLFGGTARAESGLPSRDSGSGIRVSGFRPPPAPPVPREYWHEFPHGFNGPRVVRIVVQARELYGKDHPKMQGVYTSQKEIRQELESLRNLLSAAEARRKSIEPTRTQSPGDYRTWVDLVDLVNECKLAIGQIEQIQREVAAYVAQVERHLTDPRPTTVICTVHNPLNRAWIPYDYLRKKAVAHLNENVEERGGTAYLSL